MKLWLLFAAVAALQVLDVITTLRVFKRGGGEANIVLAYLMLMIGEVPALIVSKAFFLALLLAAVIYAPSGWLAIAMIPIIGFYAWVVVHNNRLG